MIKKTFPSE